MITELGYSLAEVGREEECLEMVEDFMYALYSQTCAAVSVIPGISSGTEMYFVRKLSGTFYKTLSASSSTERSLLRLRLKK